MKRDVSSLINGYLDDALSDDEQRELSDWIKADPANATRFAQAVMLHDRLACEMSSAMDGGGHGQAVRARGFIHEG